MQQSYLRDELMNSPAPLNKDYRVAVANQHPVVGEQPHPMVNRVLGLNIAINRLNNVIPLDYGLSDTDAAAQLWEGTAENLGASSVERGVGAGASHAIRLRQGATAVREASDYPVAFVKMDVEGHEPHVVAGLETLLKEQRPVVAFEANDAMHNDDNILKRLEAIGYCKFLALDYSPSIPFLWLRVVTLTLLGVRTALKPVSNLRGARHALVFALHSDSAAAYDALP